MGGPAHACRALTSDIFAFGSLLPAPLAGHIIISTKDGNDHLNALSDIWIATHSTNNYRAFENRRARERADPSATRLPVPAAKLYPRYPSSAPHIKQYARSGSNQLATAEVVAPAARQWAPGRSTRAAADTADQGGPGRAANRGQGHAQEGDRP